MSFLDIDTLRSILPSEMNAYAKSNGWTKAEVNANKSVYWIKTFGDTEYDLEVPLQSSYSDYYKRVKEYLRTLTSLENRELEKIFFDVKHSTSDVIRIRIMHPKSDDGELPFDGSSKLVKGIEEVVAASMCSIDDKKAYFLRKPNQIKEAFKKLKASQTEKGSYIFKIVSPVPPTQQQSLFPDQDFEEPFERRFSINLYNSLIACQEAGTESIIDNTTEAFSSKVDRGINANLLDGLTCLGSIFDSNDVEITVNWASTRPTPASCTSPIFINKEFIPFIEEASKFLKETSPVEDFELQGHVEKLEKSPSAEEGKITVLANIEGSYRRVKIILKPSDYNIAVNAHQGSSQIIQCTGTLTKEGRSFELEAPRNFRTIEVD